MDHYRLVFPPVAALVVASMFFPLFYFSFGHPIWMPVGAGVLTGYVIYDCTHYYLHHATIWTSYMRFMKSYHMKHHYEFNDTLYGVSNPFWDYVFCTAEEIDVKNVYTSIEEA